MAGGLISVLIRVRDGGREQVMRVHSHYSITPEIRRELFSAPPQGATPAVPSARREETSRLLGAMAL